MTLAGMNCTYPAHETKLCNSQPDNYREPPQIYHECKSKEFTSDKLTSKNFGSCCIQKTASTTPISIKLKYLHTVNVKKNKQKEILHQFSAILYCPSGERFVLFCYVPYLKARHQFKIWRLFSK